ncbi:HPP family protein-like protein [Mollisia scopiformis]|uniref:HPP family protein-like protein n=1 Tax=Mollisia scopiformis TaxID=149040 RepID=A0A194XRY6_MOLSC|nr:HPP family protein-like protein [Mollisia scopiformis]KUJ22487.1 HPP family protein-like protein [Mollisia scopiformis]
MSSVAFDFDVDRYINPFVPRSRLYLLPKPISWFLGYRSKHAPSLGSVLVWWWAFIGAFCSILVIEAVFQTTTFKMEKSPVVIASLGAAAILEFNTIESPLAQPRNCFLGQILAAVIGVSITKLFQLNSNFENLRWVAGALSVGITSAAMGFTNTIHPPAGATALLAATSDDITNLGWFLVPLIILGSSLMLAVACIINNIQRQFPMYWWTSADLSAPKQSDYENQKEESKEDVISESAKIVVDDERIVMPSWISLDDEERSMLEVLRSKLQEGLRGTKSRDILNEAR